MSAFQLLARVDVYHWLFAIPMAVLSIFLILVILVQRGRGGGLTGALGGMGGQSAFGTKAGDLFTRITIVVAAIWVLLSMASIKLLAQRSPFDSSQKGYTQPITVPSGKTATTPPATTTPATTTPATTTPATTTPATTTPGAKSATTPESKPAATPAAPTAPTAPGPAEKANKTQP